MNVDLVFELAFFVELNLDLFWNCVLDVVAFFVWIWVLKIDTC